MTVQIFEDPKELFTSCANLCRSVICNATNHVYLILNKFMTVQIFEDPKELEELFTSCANLCM